MVISYCLELKLVTVGRGQVVSVDGPKPGLETPAACYLESELTVRLEYLPQKLMITTGCLLV